MDKQKPNKSSKLKPKNPYDEMFSTKMFKDMEEKSGNGGKFLLFFIIIIVILIILIST